MLDNFFDHEYLMENIQLRNKKGLNFAADSLTGTLADKQHGLTWEMEGKKSREMKNESEGKEAAHFQKPPPRGALVVAVSAWFVSSAWKKFYKMVLVRF
jgi:hypothetical protein